MNDKTLPMVTLLLLATPVLLPANEPVETDERSNPVLDLMLTSVAPATNRLWGVKDPGSAEEWLAYEEDAIAVLNASEALRGASADRRWQAWLDNMSAAARSASAAARERNRERFVEVTRKELYAACEACHAVFAEAAVGADARQWSQQEAPR